MKKYLHVLLASFVIAASLSGCSGSAPETTAALESPAAESNAETSSQAENKADTEFTLRVGSLKGPTSMGLVSLMDKASKGESKGSYEFTMVTAADELLAKMINGELDVALIPANMASILYQKSQHGVNVLNINTQGVLYIASSDETIQSISDLKGKTVYMTGKGTTPDYVFKYLLSANQLSEEDVTLEYKSEPAEVAAILKEQSSAIGLLPQPFMTVACAQNENLKIVLDLTKEWEKIQGPTGGSLVTGVTVCRGDLFEEHELELKVFLAEQQESVDFANDHTEETAQLVANAKIIEKPEIAQKALPYCSISYIEGDMMKSMLSGYLEVLYNQNPESVGGNLPDQAFYFVP